MNATELITALATDTMPPAPEPTPLFDALREMPKANVWRRAYLRDRLDQLSGGAR